MDKHQRLETSCFLIPPVRNIPTPESMWVKVDLCMHQALEAPFEWITLRRPIGLQNLLRRVD